MLFRSLSEDIQPGDVFLVQVPIDKQQQLYKQKGFLGLDNHLARIHPDGYGAFYSHSFLISGATNLLPRDWIRPGGAGLYHGTNGTNTSSWMAAPRVGFPSYSFSVQNGAGLSLAVPVSGVPVGLSLLASDAASGSVQIQDARTMGVDTISLHRQLQSWAETNVEFLAHFGTSATNKGVNFLRVVTRVYASGRMLVTLKDASNRSGGLDVGIPKPVNLLQPQLPNGLTNTQDTALNNFTNARHTLSEMVKAAMPATDAAGNVLPGGSLRLAAASARTVSLDETFDPPLVLGYLGFDCAIYEGGKLGSPIPTHSVLDPNFAGIRHFAEFKGALTNQTSIFEQIQKCYGSASPEIKKKVRDKAADLDLIKRADSIEPTKFIQRLRRSVDANDPEVTRKLNLVAKVCAETP